MDSVECFKIKLYKTAKPLDTSKWKAIKEISGIQSSGEPSSILADPFLLVKGDTLFLFYEDKKLFHNGVIAMISTEDLVNWSDPVIVLKESCHLSYPWVFEKEGSIYMIPETCGLNSVRLYRANSDLTEFEFVKTILKEDRKEGFSFSDSSIYEKDGLYCLMTTVNDGKNNILKLYVSTEWDGNYIEHPASPVCSNNKYGRNAGCLFELDGKLIRPAQDCENGYGNNVHLLAINKITLNEYNEVPMKENLLPTEQEFYKFGGHQFNCVKFKAHYIVATDAKEYHSFLIKRIMHKMGMFR